MGVDAAEREEGEVLKEEETESLSEHSTNAATVKALNGNGAPLPFYKQSLLV